MEIPSNLAQGRGKYCSRGCWQMHRVGRWVERFWEQMCICMHGYDCPYCCWEWQGPRCPDSWDYGLFNRPVEGKWRAQKVHRVAWELHHRRPIPKGLLGCHHCDNPPCGNPDHIYAGTPQQNMQDAARRGAFDGRRRGRILRGEDLAQTKLTDPEVRMMRQRYADGEPQYILAQDFGVSPALVSMIVNYKVRQHAT